MEKAPFDRQYRMYSWPFRTRVVDNSRLVCYWPLSGVCARKKASGKGRVDLIEVDFFPSGWCGPYVRRPEVRDEVVAAHCCSENYHLASRTIRVEFVWFFVSDMREI